MRVTTSYLEYLNTGGTMLTMHATELARPGAWRRTKGARSADYLGTYLRWVGNGPTVQCHRYTVDVSRHCFGANTQSVTY